VQARIEFLKGTEMAEKIESSGEHPMRNADSSATKLNSTMSPLPDLKDPHVVLSLLEADQVVAAKSRTRFGQRKLSPGMRAILWGLRIYVVFMLVMVAISVVQALHSIR
jgi:hypothetical protein